MIHSVSLPDYPNMEFTVEFRSFAKRGLLQASGNVVFNGVFTVRDVAVVNGKNGLFVSMPAKNLGTCYARIVFPSDEEFRKQFDEAILDAYHKEKAMRDAENNIKNGGENEYET